ncbi:MAG: hypothetical protein LUD72_09570, partial [Bacteroidales bacterium]|nr:hypothetical protein [Bacteroidales bacterium]
FVYLANVKALYNEYVQMQKQCRFYKSRIATDGEDAYMCCLCEKYDRMGGDDMKDWLNGLLGTAEERATEYLGYAQNATPKLSIKFGVFLSASVNDIGIYTPAIEAWEGGKLYLRGDKVYYDGKVYTCLEDNSGGYDSETELINFPSGELYFKADDPERFSSQTGIKEAVADSKLKSLRRSVEFYDAYNESQYPDEDEDWLFYYRKNQVVNIETSNDEWGNILRYDRVAYDAEKAGGNCGTDEEVVPWNNEETPYDDGATANNLMAYGDVLSDISAENGKLTFTYHIGVHLLATYEGNDADDDGNRHYYFSNFVADTDDIQHLITYTEEYNYSVGGFQLLTIQKVVVDTDEWKGEADLDNITDPQEDVLYELVDENRELDPEYALYFVDGNTATLIICLVEEVKNLSDVPEPTRGVVYHIADTNYYYQYKAGDDIDSLVVDGVFDKYVEGEYDLGGSLHKIENLAKFSIPYPFSTSNNSVSVDKTVNGEGIQYKTNIATYDATISKCRDWQTTQLFKEDYLMGISTPPSVKADVRISRGSTSAFERFIKFSEVKTLDAMEEYSNGSFFVMIEDS